MTNIMNKNGDVDTKEMSKLRRAIQKGEFEKEDLRDLNEAMASMNRTDAYEDEMKEEEHMKP